MYGVCIVLFFKQKTAYEMRISDWSSDVCSSDLAGVSRLWCHTVGQVPLRLPSPAAQASAVLRLKPTVGQGRPNSAYCFTKLVTWLPARLRQTMSGCAWRTFSR